MVARRTLFRAAAIFVVGAFVVAVVGVSWLLGSAGGAGVAMAFAGLKSTGLEGRLLGPLSAQSVEWRQPNLVVRVENPRFEWKPSGLLRGTFHVTSVSADAVLVATPPSEERAKPPLTLEPPLAIRVDRAAVKQVRIGTLAAGGAWTPGFEVNEIALDSVAAGERWTFESAGAVTAAGRVDVKGWIASVRPFRLDITAQLRGERDGKAYRIAGRAQGELAKFEAKLTGEEGGITGEATAAIEPFEAQPLRRVQGRLAGIDANAFASGAPRTDATVEMNVAATSDGALAGTARLANAAPGSLDRQRVPVTEARGNVRVKGRRVELRGMAIAMAGGGSAAGDLAFEGLHADAELAVKQLDLSTWHAKLRPTKLSGDIVAAASRDAQRFEVALADPQFSIAGRATIAGGRLEVPEATLSRQGSSAAFKGTLDLGGRRAFDVAGTLDRVNPAHFAAMAEGEVSGTFAARGTLEPAPAGEVSLELAPSRYADRPLSGHLKLAGDAKRLARADVDLKLGDASARAQGAFGRPPDALEVAIDLPKIAPVAELFGIEAGGVLHAEGTIGGTFAAPTGKATVVAKELALPGGYRVASLDAKLEGGRARTDRVAASLAITEITRSRAQGAPTLLAKEVKLDVTGTVGAHRLALQATLPPEPTLGLVAATPAQAPRDPRLRITLAGGTDEKAPALTWRGRIESASFSGPMSSSLAAPATLVVSRDLVEVGDAAIKGDYGQARFAVTRWTPSHLEARGKSEGLLMRPVVRALGLPANPRSNLVLAAEWDLKAAETLEGYLRMKRVSGDVRLGDPVVHLGLEEFSAGLEASRGEVRVSALVRGAQVGRLEARATTRLRREAEAWSLPREAPLSGELVADMPSIAWAADWLGPDAHLAGALKARVALGGSLGTPTWKGDASLQDLVLKEPGLGVEIDSGRVAIALDEREVAIRHFELATTWRIPRRGQSRLVDVTPPERGTIVATGGLDFATRSGSITMTAKQFPFSQHPSRFIAASGEAKVEAKAGGVALTAALKADAGWFGIPDAAAPSVSDDVLIVRDGAMQPVVARDRQKLTLDVRFGLGDQIYFSGRGLATRLAGEIRLRGEPGRSLVSSGTIRTEGGTYDAYGQKLTIERGVLNFQGPVDNPGLNVLAVRTGLPVVAGVEILGSVSRPNVRLYSRPDVPDNEKLTWLVLGRGPSESNEGDAATLLAAANALLGGSPENRRMLRSLGVDEFRIGRGEGSSALGAMPQSTVAGRTGSTSGAEVLTVGRRLTKDIRVSYQQSLADAEASLRFTYDVTKKLQLLLIAGDKPGVDAVYRFQFD